MPFGLEIKTVLFTSHASNYVFVQKKNVLFKSLLNKTHCVAQTKLDVCMLKSMLAGVTYKHVKQLNL